ncbi:MAG: HEAT repeat domain-containing protein, partial [Planctomycetota bacterium]
MTTLLRRSVWVLTLAAVVGAGALARAQDAAGPQRAKYQEAVRAIKAGDYEEATERLDEVLALNPSSTEALELRNLTETEVIIQALTKGPQPLRKKMLGLLQLAAEAERQRLTDRGRIKGAIEDLLGGFEVRHKAYVTLVSAGRYAVPLLVDKLLATEDPDYKKYRVRCTIALMRIGEEAVIPLCTALRSRSGSLRQDIVFALGEIGDPRAVPYLLRTAQSDPDPQVRA